MEVSSTSSGRAGAGAFGDGAITAFKYGFWRRHSNQKQERITVRAHLEIILVFSLASPEGGEGRPLVCLVNK